MSPLRRLLHIDFNKIHDKITKVIFIITTYQHNQKLCIYLIKNEIGFNGLRYLILIDKSVLGSSATAGTTGATVMLTLTLSTLGLPLEGVGLLLAVEPIVDMGRTALNVTGQALVAAVVGTREGVLDQAVYDARPQFAA